MDRNGGHPRDGCPSPYSHGVEPVSQVKQTPLADLIIRLADNKYALGRRFSEWTNGAPTLEAAVAAAAMTQDEVGQARSLYAALQGLPDSPEAYVLDAPRKRDHPLRP